MKKQIISKWLRKLKILYVADWIRFYIQKIKNRKTNREFINNNPNVSLPPDYLIYESFRMNYERYYIGGVEAGKQLVSNFEKHIVLKNKIILDWGCGPARIIRHFPNIIGNECRFYGSDYNKKTIEWCSNNIENVAFNNNSLAAKLPYENEYFDVIYGLSVLTHLSEQLHYDWFLELCRVLNKNGILYLTTQGDNFKDKMTDEELNEYSNGNIIVRGNVLEGHRTYSAFHPTKFMKELFGNVEILEHIVTTPVAGWIPQDIWIIKKK